MVEARPPERHLLQQFARFPSPGQVKTRLQLSLSAEEACAVHEELLLQTAATLTGSKLAPVELWLDRCDEHPTLARVRALGAQGPFLQRGGDLGARMYAALHEGLSRASAVVLVGSDCPVLSAAYLSAAFDALRSAAAVLGPADDGGFVLIGARRVHPGMFDAVTWGQAQTLRETRKAMTAQGLEPALLDPLYDIDTPGDLSRWRESQRQA
jgi:rSAM/selenodomain-associated transferase 1